MGIIINHYRGPYFSQPVFHGKEGHGSTGSILVQVMEMLVEGPHKSRHNVLRGRLRNGRICHVSGSIQVPNGLLWDRYGLAGLKTTSKIWVCEYQRNLSQD